MTTPITESAAASLAAPGPYATSASVASLSASVATLSGRNRIINGNFAINQRAYGSGAATGIANQYTLDRWRVVVSGQSATFAASGNGNLVTAPAGGLEQVIEGNNIEGGTSVLSWTGTATATLNGAAIVKGASATLTANTNATVRFSSGTVGLVQLEAGSVATPFERRSYGQELALCQRYYQTFQTGVITAAQAAANSVGNWVSYLPMRAAPTAAWLGGASENVNLSSINISPVTVGGARIWGSATAAGVCLYTNNLALSAEL